jgi:hypothetical protein
MSVPEQCHCGESYAKYGDDLCRCKPEVKMTDKLEFYFEDKQNPFIILDSSFQPNDGDLVNIKGVTYVVLGRSFSVDHSAKPERSIRCNVILREQTAKE